MKRSRIKIVIGLLGFGVFGLVFYLVLLSPLFANNVLVMKLRYQYVMMVDKIDLLKPTIRAVRVDDDNPDLYVYLLQGKIEKADPGGLYMRGRDGKIYGFLIKWDSVGEGWVRKVGTSTSDVKMKNWKRILMTFNIDDINKSGSTDDTEGGKYTPFEQDQEYGIIWKDPRRLTQIMEASEKHPELPINLKYNQIWSVVQYE